MASAGLDAMPHASGVVLANSVAKTDMKDTYKYTFVSQCLIPMLAFGLGVILYLMGLCLAFLCLLDQEIPAPGDPFGAGMLIKQSGAAGRRCSQLNLGGFRL